jgi:uncharacterized membrane protein YfcA
MELYLPVAEMSVNWAVIVALGAAVGFLSGMFGVGGGFLMTPLLIFYGIPPGVAVATQASHITASSLSGSLAHWKARALDPKMGLVMLAGGIAGAAAGVWVFAWLKDIGQIDFAVPLLYVVVLGGIGAIMLRESLLTLRRERANPAPAKPRLERNWIHALPLKARFRHSKVYISIVPPVLLGALVGFLGSLLGIGGGFLLVPAMIYLLRMPAGVVLGTSQFQILFVSVATTILQAVTNHAVDIALAFLLIAGGVIGVQFGVRAAARLHAAQLRALLAAVVILVAAGLLYQLVATPTDLYSVASGKP